MKSTEHTIESGLQALLAKSKYHRDQAERFDRLALSFREAEAVLHTTNGEAAKVPGRPQNGDARKILVDAIDAMPTEFGLTMLKQQAKGLKPALFYRLFRDVRKDGLVIEKVRAAGRREGIYVKSERATSID